MIEPDNPPPPNTWRKFMWTFTAGLQFARAFWGRRLYGGAIALFGDVLSEGVTQAFYARLPGHPQQYTGDSLIQVGTDRKLARLQGESDTEWLTRVKGAWEDYAQGGSPQQMLSVVNAWGSNAFPGTWVTLTAGALVESAVPTIFTATITITQAAIANEWLGAHACGGTNPVTGPYLCNGPYGAWVENPFPSPLIPHAFEAHMVCGVSNCPELQMLRFLVRKWKPARTKMSITVTGLVTCTI